MCSFAFYTVLSVSEDLCLHWMLKMANCSMTAAGSWVFTVWTQHLHITFPVRTSLACTSVSKVWGLGQTCNPCFSMFGIDCCFALPLFCVESAYKHFCRHVIMGHLSETLALKTSCRWKICADKLVHLHQKYQKSRFFVCNCLPLCMQYVLCNAQNT